MLQISIYYSASHDEWTEVEGKHGRLKHHGGMFDAKKVLMEEIAGDYDRYVDGRKQNWSGEERGDILVAGKGIRSKLQRRTDMISLRPSSAQR